MRSWIPLLLAVAGAPVLLSQKPAPKPPPPAAEEEPVSIKVDVDLVSIFASVRDKRGAYIKNLEQSAFSLYEDGIKQEIRYFTRETDLPLTIGLLVDTSKSQENLIDIEKRAAGQFFQQVLRNKDMAFLMQFGSEAELLQDMTSSPKTLQRGLDGLRLSVPVGGLGPGPTGSAQQRGTILYDAVYLAATEQLKKEVGRKVIVIISDGVDHGSRVKMQDAIAAAHKSDVIIYSIYYSDPQYRFFGGGDGDLRRMSEDTGGRVFHVDRRDTLESIFNQLQEEMRSQYAIGYSSSNAGKPGTFRKVEFRMASKEHRVQARKGYYVAGGR